MSENVLNYYRQQVGYWRGQRDRWDRFADVSSCCGNNREAMTRADYQRLANYASMQLGKFMDLAEKAEKGSQ